MTALVSAAVLSGCSGNTAAPGTSDTEPVSTDAVSASESESASKALPEASLEAENPSAEIEAVV